MRFVSGQVSTLDRGMVSLAPTPWSCLPSHPSDHPAKTWQPWVLELSFPFCTSFFQALCSAGSLHIAISLKYHLFPDKLIWCAGKPSLLWFAKIYYCSTSNLGSIWKGRVLKMTAKLTWWLCFKWVLLRPRAQCLYPVECRSLLSFLTSEEAIFGQGFSHRRVPSLPARLWRKASLIPPWHVCM